MMRGITAAFAEEEIQAGPVVAWRIQERHDASDRLHSRRSDRGVYSVVAGTAYTPIRGILWPSPR